MRLFKKVWLWVLFHLSNKYPNSCRATYSVEKDCNYLNLSVVHTGKKLNLSKINSNDFRDKIIIYCNGSLLWNDEKRVNNETEIERDVALWDHKKNCLVFNKKIQSGSVIQIIDMR